MPNKVILSVGTTRGLFLLHGDRKRAKWNIKGPFLKGWEVYHAMVDTRGKPMVHVAASQFTFSYNTFRGDIQGRKFEGCKKPPAPPKPPAKAAKFAKQYGLDMSPRVWHIEPGPAKDKKVLYAGTAPAGLFRSTDGGKTWREMKGINNHPTRKHWNPGAGGMCLHSIQIDPSDSNRMYVGISAAGAFRTDNGGRTWSPINKAVSKYIGAPKEGEVGT